MNIPALAEIENAARAAFASEQPERAEELVRAAFARGGETLVLWVILAKALRKLGRHSEARQIQERLLLVQPQNYDFHFDLAETCLLLGDFERGWKEYRFRYNLAHTKVLDRKVQKPRWSGDPIPGKALLIYDEQGFGDTFQFIRLVELAKQRSQANTILQITPRQASFARRMNTADKIILRGELPPAFDAYCEMMSLPLALGLKLEDLPGRCPYLTVDPDRVAKWRPHFENLPRPVVALCWSGRPEHFDDTNRSLHLTQLASLAKSAGTFVSVQKGTRAAEALEPPGGMPLIGFGDEEADFDDTAAILSFCDLLISVDTSPAHLAGALGVPTWLMLTFSPDWRWLLERSDSPWYPNHRLFRQPRRGDWNSVIAELAAALAQRFPETCG